DKQPAKLTVVVTRRPKLACRSCEKTVSDKVAGIIQAPAPARLIEGGLPTGGPQIDDQLELCRRLHRKIGRLLALSMRSTYEAERRKISCVLGPYDISPPSAANCRNW